MLALLIDPPFQVFQGGAGLDQPVDLVARGIVRSGLAVRKRLSEPGDRIGVDRIVLGEAPGRLGEATSFRIDDNDLEAGRAQRFRPAALIIGGCAAQAPSPFAVKRAWASIIGASGANSQNKDRANAN